MDWSTAPAPSLDDFARLAEQALALVPPALRGRCGDIILRVADFPDQEMLDALGLEDPFELTGVYQGVDLTQKTSFDPAPEPDMVVLYRRPILDEWAEEGDIPLGELVTHVLIHEIGHHFGFSDEDMHRLQEG